ncbi:VOC family protein [Streptomyces sp. NPDC048417]|uniref:VOC family protein n=1 Tax=Streptomyces sp. NPDC048417 TaxID=3155387 RepID=UPI00344A3530
MCITVGIDVVTVPEPGRQQRAVHTSVLLPPLPPIRRSWLARLQALGATPADAGQGDVPWTVRADPEDNEFCVPARS